MRYACTGSNVLVIPLMIRARLENFGTQLHVNHGTLVHILRF